MYKSKYILPLVLALWISCLDSILYIDTQKQHPLIHFASTIVPTGPQVEYESELIPDYYLLKIKHTSKPGQSKDVFFNGQTISAFKVLKQNNLQTDYYKISPNQVEKYSSLRMIFDSGFPEEVTIKFRNYRNSYLSDNIVAFFRPASYLYKPMPLRLAIGFLLVFSCFVITFFVTKEPGKKAAIFLIFTLNIFLTAAAANNLLPLSQYVIFVNLTNTLFLLFLTLCCFFVLLCFKRTKDEFIDEPAAVAIPTRQTQQQTAVIFIALLSFLLVLRTVLVVGMRIPMGHDTFHYLQIQYNLFFNEPARTGYVPQWLPFMTHGTLSNIWVFISHGLLTSVLIPFIKFLKHINFFYIFQAGLLFDELVLLLGCVLLAKRCFRSIAAILFVVSSMTFTTITSTQIWYDFHLVYLLPLTLYCFYHALQDVSAKYLFLTGLFFVGMTLGNLPYFAPVLIFCILVFGLMIYIYLPSQTSATLRKFLLGFRVRHILAVLIPCLLAATILIFLKQGVENIVSYNIGRDTNFKVSGIREFMMYGGNINIHKYLEFISRYSNNIDNTIYAGLLVIPFVILTLLRVRSRLSYAFGTASLIMALFSAGIVIPIIFYYLFPFGKYYRHIGLIGPLVKLFVVFYAGFGFDLFWHSLGRLRNSFSQGIFTKDKVNLLIVCVVMLYIFVLVLINRFSNLPLFDFSGWIRAQTENQLYRTSDQISSALSQLLGISSVFTMLFLVMLQWPSRTKIIGLFLIVVHLFDVASFKVECEYRRIPQVDKNVVDLFNVYNYSFSNKRSQDYFSNSRFLSLVPFIFYEDKIPFDTNEPASPVGKYGALYWSTASFIFFDPVSHIFRTDHWLKGIDAFYSVWVPNSKRKRMWIGFPIPQSVAFKKLSGYDFSKLQLFSKIHILPTENDVAEVMSSPDFQGDMLLSSGLDSQLKKIGTAVFFDSKNNINLKANERVTNAELSVQEFSFDKLRVLVNNYAEVNALLYYADAWHPRWHAYVNGRPAFIFKSNIGYKSVVIPPGKSEVIFQFGDAVSKLLFNGLIAIGICVFLGIIYVLFTELPVRYEKK